jgi:hypothetical protein
MPAKDPAQLKAQLNLTYGEYDEREIPVQKSGEA